jgi:hypothetical protein
MTTTSKTKTAKLVAALTTGTELTAAQISHRFGIANPSATVDYLRKNGHSVYCNPRENARGETRNFYRLGTPTKAVVAAGRRALAMSA